MTSSIRLADVSKRFRLHRHSVDRMLSWMSLPSRSRDFWALRHIDIEVPRGRTLGIVGPNGAGKSTLLKIVTGTLVPTAGQVHVAGRVAALLELGTGFHPEFTGRQNIRVNGQLLGLTPDEIARHEREIIAFSELGPFIDQPLRTYSSGMVLRLGFAIAASVEPQILIVDEALAVGDARFSQKCIRRIREFREAGCTILFVSHDAMAVSTLCDEAILLDQGRLVHRGAPDEVLERYGALLALQGQGNSEMRVRWVAPGEATEEPAATRYGSFQALVAGIELLRDDDGSHSDVFLPGATLRLVLTVLFLSEIENPTVGIMIRDRLGVDVFGTNTALLGMKLGTFAAGDSARIEVRLPLLLGDGDYTITAAVHRDETHLEECYDWTDRLAIFQVRSASRPTCSGRVRLNSQWTCERQARDGATLPEALTAVFGAFADPLPLEGLSPAPFLGGFHGVERTSHDVPFRWCGRRGWFVFRPTHARLVLAVGLPPLEGDGDARRISLRSVAAGEVGSCRLDAELGLAEFTLPASCLGRPGLYELAVDAAWREPTDSGPGRELGVALYALRTIPDGEGLPPWDAIVQSNSSAESSAS